MVVFDLDDVIALAQFCAELVRQGVTFECKKRTWGLTERWVVTFTGGS